MKQSHTNIIIRKPSLWLCFVCSALIHIMVALLVFPIRFDSVARKSPLSRKTVRFVTVSRNREKESPMKTVQTPEKEPLFVKTAHDQESSLRPKTADYIGSRHTIASGSGKSPEEQTERNLPNIDGEKERGEIVLFDRERQDGDLESEDEPSSLDMQPTPPLPSEKALADDALSSNPICLTASDGNITSEQSRREKENCENAAPSIKEYLAEGQSGMRLTTPLEVERYMKPIVSLGEIYGNDSSEIFMPQTPSPRLPYDPSFTASSQPGFRTKEKRTRTTGRFVLGSKPSLNVEKTPKGMYQALIYRRIAYYWYRECDANRDMIIPGSLHLRLLVNTRGQITAMDLLKRTGASVSQQGFTFRAVRCAEIPPMPTEVRRDIVGDKMELIFDFYFD